MLVNIVITSDNKKRKKKQAIKIIQFKNAPSQSFFITYLDRPFKTLTTSCNL